MGMLIHVVGGVYCVHLYSGIIRKPTTVRTHNKNNTVQDILYKYTNAARKFVCLYYNNAYTLLSVRVNILYNTYIKLICQYLYCAGTFTRVGPVSNRCMYYYYIIKLLISFCCLQGDSPSTLVLFFPPPMLRFSKSDFWYF